MRREFEYTVEYLDMLREWIHLLTTLDSSGCRQPSLWWLFGNNS